MKTLTEKVEEIIANWPREVQDAYRDAAQQALECRSYFARTVKYLADQYFEAALAESQPQASGTALERATKCLEHLYVEAPLAEPLNLFTQKALLILIAAEITAAEQRTVEATMEAVKLELARFNSGVGGWLAGPRAVWEAIDALTPASITASRERREAEK